MAGSKFEVKFGLELWRRYILATFWRTFKTSKTVSPSNTPEPSVNSVSRILNRVSEVKRLSVFNPAALFILEIFSRFFRYRVTVCATSFVWSGFEPELLISDRSSRAFWMIFSWDLTSTFWASTSQKSSMLSIKKVLLLLLLSAKKTLIKGNKARF